MDYEAVKKRVEKRHEEERLRRAALTPEQRAKEDQDRQERRRRIDAESPFKHPELAVAWYDCGPFQMVGRAWHLAKVALGDLSSGGRRHTEVRWNRKGCCSQQITWRDE